MAHYVLVVMLSSSMRLLPFFSVSVDCKEIITLTYNGMSDVRYGAPRLGNHWKAPTLASCLVACRSYYPSCYSVVFNGNTQNCTPGDKIMYGVPRPSNSTRDKFYFTDYCNQTQGYRLYIYKSVVGCFYLAQKWAIYTEAQSNCSAIGGRVMQAKTQDRFDLFLHFAKNVFGTYTFLGLTDQATDGIFQWEDGEVISSTWKDTIYMYGEGTANSPTENCTVAANYSSFIRVYDGRCDLTVPHLRHYYICELIT